MSQKRTVKVLRKQPKKNSEILAHMKKAAPKVFWCGWCYTEKHGTNAPCPSCGCFMTTSTPQSSISHVYIEDIPA